MPNNEIFVFRVASHLNACAPYRIVLRRYGDEFVPTRLLSNSSDKSKFSGKNHTHTCTPIHNHQESPLHYYFHTTTLSCREHFDSALLLHPLVAAQPGMLLILLRTILDFDAAPCCTLWSAPTHTTSNLGPVDVAERLGVATLTLQLGEQVKHCQLHTTVA